MARSVKWDLVADSSRFERGFGRAVATSGKFEKRLEHLNRRAGGFGSTFAKLGGVLAGAFAATSVVSALKSTVDAAREAERVGKITQARLKSTGHAANVSARQIEQLAGSLSRKVGVDDEVIQSGANMLLTFKGVRNEVGRNNDIFNQATGLAVDLAAGLHQGQVSAEGLQSANLMLGKALEDPIRGITALRRAGVSFTAAQREQITTLVETGHTLEAQKIILKAVGEQFAGTAEAAATPWSKLKVQLGNFQEWLGTKLLPAVDGIATVVTEKVVPAVGDLITKAKDWWEVHGPAVKDAFIKAKDEVVKLGDELGDLKQDWDDNKAAVQGLIDTLKPLAGVTLPAVRWLIHRLATDEIGGKFGLIAQLGWLSKAFTFVFKRAVQELRPFVSGFLTAMAAVLEAALATVSSIPGGRNSTLGKNLQHALESVKGWRTGFNKTMDEIEDEKVKVNAHAGITWTAEAAHFRERAGRMAQGGLVRGPGTGISDSVPAMLSRGEFVMSAAAVRQIGAGQLEQLNAMRFARGGLVLDARGGRQLATAPLQRMATGLAKGLSAAVGRGLVLAMRTAWQGLGGFSGAGLSPAEAWIIARESGGNVHADNPTSTAFGLGQLLLANRQHYGRLLGYSPNTTNYAQQLAMFRAYVSDRYGTAENAKAFWGAHGWYGSGGIFTKPTIIGVGERGPEAVIPLGRGHRGGGIDYGRLGQEVARALRENPPVVSVDAIHTGLKAKRNRNQRGLGLETYPSGYHHKH